jgi:protoheme IX farnesyltransferase
MELTKPRVVLMVLITTLVGFYLGSRGALDYPLLFHTLAGTALSAAGTLALNQFLEREVDALMERTRLRPLPTGRLSPTEAFAFGTALTAGGLLYLTFTTGLLSAAITLTIVVSYLFAYTPLKRKTSLCSIVGAIPGSLPPVIGWAAASSELGTEAWVLFSILFFWQIPHSLAIARVYRVDYARAGILLLPVLDPDGSSTERQIVTHSIALLAVGLLPTLVGLTGWLYFLAALVLGTVFLGYSLALVFSRSPASARQLLIASLVYLPVLLLIMAIDKVHV